MAILTRGSAHPKRSRGGVAGGGASIREVCLLGVGSPGYRPGAGPGDAVRSGGRVYRVVASDGGGALHVCPADLERP